MAVNLCLALTLVFNLANCDEKEEVPVLKPIITRVSPEKGFPGMIISISGQNFLSKTTANVVKINKIIATVKEVKGDSLLMVLVPDDATTGGIHVEVDKQISNELLFTIPRNQNPPVITSVTPFAVEIGDLVTIIGSNFKSGLEIDKNTVRMSGLKVKIASATSTELKVYVPGVPKLPTVSVTVSVLGTQSNAVPLKVKSFPGTMAWASVSYQANHMYWVTAEADGSTFFSNRKIDRTDAFRDLFADGGPGQSALKTGVPVSSPSGQTLYFLSPERISYDPYKTYQIIYQSATQFDDVKPIYSIATTGDGSPDSDLFVEAIAPDVVGNGLYVFTMSKSTGQRYLERAFKDGTQPLERVRELSNSYSLNNVSLTASSQAIYVTSEVDLWKIPLEVSEPESYLVTGLTSTLSAVEYNPSDNHLYVLGSINNDRVELYRMEDNVTPPQLLASYQYTSTSADEPPVYARYLRILSGDNGLSTKVFWVNRGSTGADEILFINLKGEGPYTPVTLYDKPEEIGYNPSTLPWYPGYSGASVGFLHVFN